MGTATNTDPGSRRGATVVVVNILTGLSPIVILTSAFLLRVEALSAIDLAGVALTSILVACAVFNPLLSYLVSAPVFAAIDGAGASDHAEQCATVRRALPPMVPWAVLLGAASGTGLGTMLGWPLPATGALVANFSLHLVLAVTMVAGFATRRPAMLLATWLAYGVALVAFPAMAWWLPPATAAVVHCVWLLIVARGTASVALPSASRLLRSVPIGFMEGAPIWLIGPVLWLLDPENFLAGVYYPALIPGLIGYQVFMFAVALPLWRGIGDLGRSLSTMPYAQARENYRTLTRKVTLAAVLIVLGHAALASLGLWATSYTSSPQPSPYIVMASCTNCLVFALAYLCRIAGRNSPLAATSAAMTVLAVVTLWAGLSDHAYLVGVIALALPLALRSAAVGRSAWRRPEYTLFWRREAPL